MRVALLATLWPALRPAPMILAITYDPPMRAPRYAPPNLRVAGVQLSAEDLAMLIADLPRPGAGR